MAKGKRRAGRGDAARPVTPQTLGPARRASRAALRERRRRQRRRRLSAAAIAGIAVVVVAAVALVGGVVAHSKKSPPPKGRTQRTLLFEVTDRTGAARVAVLYAYDPAPRRAALVLIPTHTLADVAGLGNVVFATAARLGGPTVAREAVSDLLGVTVDQDWTLTDTAFTSLIDRAGGVVVDVDADVVQALPHGASRILVRAGPGQRLDGPTALAYATYVQKGQDEVTSLARLQQVLEAVFGALPADRTSLATSIAALGSGSRLSWQPPDLADFILGVRAARDGDRYEPQVLPVSVIDTGGGAVTYSIKVDDVASLVRAELADSIPPNRDLGNNRVLVLNGVGTPGLGAGVARKLRGEFRIVGTRNKQPFDVKTSVVVVFDSSDASLAKARRAATLLGLPETAVRIGTQAQSVADVIVVIGADYRQ
jgi:anionic cell wall polymer biosynthesis LytR-Cps2A-Psr (LCP) family protein